MQPDLEMEFNRTQAEKALEEAGKSNPGPWTDHSRYVAMACENIAARCPGLSTETAYLVGLLHDIGRHVGICQERHMIEGYRYCHERGWEKAAQICISHSFMVKDIKSAIGTFDITESDYNFMARFVEDAVYDDYDLLVQLCDSLALPTGFCLLEKRFVDVTLRYGVHPYTVERWKAVFAIKEHFEEMMGCSIYDVLPGVIENSMK